ncbi:MAG: 23S rRNA (adenine(2503)-C(2))-methyltransferase RlmN [Desulfobacterales bacterium]|nr:23S rRNA (adenine(2503)-C(2))-methyltransferase RlmN [Desulfobacterales bacterium]
MKLPDIKDLTPDELASWLSGHGHPRYRLDQIYRWIYQRQADSFEVMTDLGKTLREELAASFTIRRHETLCMETSRDGTRKFLFQMVDGARIESVLIPEKDHDTLCISSQVGCAQGCRFCMTGRGGLARNLTAAEIVSQVRDVKCAVTGDLRLTNIVVMGMGEPLANYDNMLAALNVLTDVDTGLGFSGRHITLSTAGVVPRLADLGRDTNINLAVSLNATDNPTRSRLMPINRAYPMETLLAACARYPLAPRRRITFEYILMAGINDSPDDARRLARLLRPIRSKINLIPFNPHEGSEFHRPAPPVIERFRQILVDKGYTVITRHSKGQDISAACGQLEAKIAEQF